MPAREHREDAPVDRAEPGPAEAFSRRKLPDPVADAFAIWRGSYADGVALAPDAMRILRDAVA
ncbi:hypothetical protein [Pseudolysinimonas sp.]